MESNLQFALADYVAIASPEEGDPSALRWRGCGPSDMIVALDVKFTDLEASKLGPTIIALRVARTGVVRPHLLVRTTETNPTQPIIHPDGVLGMRPDPFYGERQPRMMICLPVQLHGKQAGVSFENYGQPQMCADGLCRWCSCQASGSQTPMWNRTLPARS